jgi:Uma2 family endonuclease
MPVSELTYQQIMLEDPEGLWELHHGRLREKPGMSSEHNDAMTYLGILLQQQLDRRQYRVRVNAGHLHVGSSYYIPDVAVIPTELVLAERGKPFELYAVPLPLVVEIWSPSTGGYDVDAKLPEYQRLGDREVWRIHPLDRTLTCWRRQPDGSYAEMAYQGGVVAVASLPGVTIELDALFE